MISEYNITTATQTYLIPRVREEEGQKNSIKVKNSLFPFK
jgi:hypothetical protein